MGLDMYLYKTKKVEGFSAMDYAYADEALDYKREKAKAKEVGEKFKETLASWGVPENMTLEKAEVLESEYKSVGNYFEWFSIFDKVRWNRRLLILFRNKRPLFRVKRDLREGGSIKSLSYY